jgi:hypothetical protein
MILDDSKQIYGQAVSAPLARYRFRVIVALAIGLTAGFVFYLCWTRAGATHPDLWEPWFGARALVAGIDPYPIVGPGRAQPNEFLFIYPLTASVMVLPLAWLSLLMASCLFVGASSALLAYAVTKDGWHRLILFISVPFAAALWGAQWSTIFSAAFLLPGLAWAYVAKPSTGAALLMATWSARAWAVAIAGGLIFTVAAMVFFPQWPLEWLATLKANTSHMTPPVLRPGGFIALVALLRWRRPEARLIAFLSLVPQTALWYEALPLLLVPKSRRETIALSLLTSLPILYEANFGLADGSFDVYPRGMQLALFAYLPAVIMVLRRRNEGSLPSWFRLPAYPRRESGAIVTDV